MLPAEAEKGKKFLGAQPTSKNTNDVACKMPAEHQQTYLICETAHTACALYTSARDNPKTCMLEIDLGKDFWLQIGPSNTTRPGDGTDELTMSEPHLANSMAHLHKSARRTSNKSNHHM